MSTLKAEHKELIVRELACYKEPWEIAEFFQDNYPELKVSSQQISYYNPNTNMGKKLGKKWVAMFHDYRDQFDKGALSVPIAQKEYRLRELWDIYLRHKRKGEFSQARATLRQAQAEMEILEGNQPTSMNFFQQVINNTLQAAKDEE